MNGTLYTLSGSDTYSETSSIKLRPVTNIVTKYSPNKEAGFFTYVDSQIKPFGTMHTEEFSILDKRQCSLPMIELPQSTTELVPPASAPSPIPENPAKENKRQSCKTNDLKN